jgi:hypothetical protein
MRARLADLGADGGALHKMGFDTPLILTEAVKAACQSLGQQHQSLTKERLLRVSMAV